MAISWSETAPSDTSAANLADDEIRSTKSNIAGGLANSMYWPGTGGSSVASAGQPLPGAWRAYYGTQSLVSAYADGALFITSDTSRIFGVGSGGTMLLGSARVVENVTWPGTNVRWVETSGSTTAQNPVVSFGAGYASLPVVTVSVQPSVATTYVPVITTLSAAQAAITVYRMDGTQPSGYTVFWRSLGTVSF